MRAYDLLADEFAESFDGFFQRFGHIEAAHFLASLDREDRILDLGCGGGSASKYFGEQGYETISADLSTGMLIQCRMRGLRDLVRLDLEALPFGRCAFAGIWAHTSLLHVPKVRLAGVLDALAEAIKPGGRLFVALRTGEGEGYRGESGLERWFSSFGQTEFEAYMPAGFRVAIRAQTDLKRTTFLNYHLVKASEGK
jgi:SAM-dependent methyltransferase